MAASDTPVSTFRRCLLKWLFVGLLPCAVVAVEPLATLTYRITGSSLTITPAALSVPKSIAGSVGVTLAGLEAPSGSYVEGYLRGPSFPARRLVGAANEPLLLPPLNLVGDYQLDGIRLAAADGTTLVEGSPSSVPVRVFDEVLVSRVESRPLSMQEIQDKGIVIDENNFRAVEFEVGFVIDGKTVSVKFPVIAPDFRQSTEIIPAAELEKRLKEADLINQQLAGTLSLPPSLETAQPNIVIKALNFQQVDDQDSDGLGLKIPPIPALMVIPGNIGYLNQFFSVLIFTENGSPAGSGLSVHSLRAELVLPQGADRLPGDWQTPGDDPLRFARVGEGAVIANMLPVRQPGADGQVGTADDVDRLQPGQTGQAEFLVEGLQEGLHVMDLKLSAKLDGFAAGTVNIEGLAAGSVMVRNPRFSMAFTHPRTVRFGEPYEASVTILNTSQVPANLVSVNLSRNGVSGGVLESDETVELGTIMPGKTAVATYRIRAQRTGSISFSNLTTSEDSVIGRFRLRTGVDERGVALSPDTLLLPDFVEHLPERVRIAANRMLGQALSAATAGFLPPGVLPVTRDMMRNKALELAEAGQRVAYGEPMARVLADLVLDWHGGRVTSNGWDQLLRETDAGLEWREAMMLAMEEAEPANGVNRLAVHAPDWAGRGEAWWISGASEDAITLSLKGEGTSLAALGSSLLRNASGYPGGLGPWLASRPTGGVFQWETLAAVPGEVELALLKVGADGTAQLLRWTLNAPLMGLRASFDSATGGLDLAVDDNGDGAADRAVTGTSTLFTETPPAVIAVRQDTTVKNGRPFPTCYALNSTDEAGEGIGIENYANVLAVLFNKPMTQATANVPGAYQLDNGNAGYAVQIQPGGRVALVTMALPVGALAARVMTSASSIHDTRGNALVPGTVPVFSMLGEGVVLRGRVVRSDGSMAAGVPVTLTYYDEYSSEFDGCQPFTRRPAQAMTDAEGRFQFDLVLAGIPYSLSATDTSGLNAAAIQAVLDATLEDQLARRKLEELADSPSVRKTLLGEFAVGSITEAIAKAEGLDRAIIRDMIEVGSARMGTDNVVALRFRGRGTVIGQVLAADGVSPVTGAVVNLFPDTTSRELGRGLVCDNEGRFAFYGVPLGVFTVEGASAIGQTRAIADTLTTPGEVKIVDIILSATAPVMTSLQGRVTEPDGQPHVGAQVYIGRFDDGKYVDVVAYASADSGGYWSASNIPVGSYDPLALSVDGKRKGVRRGIFAVAGSIGTVNHTLQARATVIGRVESSTGVPVAGAVVGGGEILATSDALGRFTLTGVPTGPGSISAVLPEDPNDPQSFARQGSGTVDVIAGAENFVTVRLAAVGRIIGRVFDAAGQPVQMAVAIPRGDGFFWTDSDAQGNFEFSGLGLGTYTASAPAPPHEEVFDAAAVIDTIRTGSLEDVLAAVDVAFAAFTGVNNPYLNGEGDNFNPSVWGFTENIRLQFDGQTIVADVRLLRTGTISGMVINGQGVPIGARVRLTGIGSTRAGAPTIVLRGERDTDPALGTFEFAGQALIGDWGLQTASPFYPVVLTTAGRTTDLEPNVSGIVMQFPAVKETNGRLAGQVLMPDGSPAGADVNVQISFGSDYVIRTDSAGRFDTQITLPAGGYSIEAEDPVTGAKGTASASVLAGQTNRATVRLLGRGNIELQVTEADGTPVPGAPVEVNGGTYPHERFTGTTGLDGRIAFSNVFEGSYGANASIATASARIAGRASLVVPLGGTGSATIVLTPTGNVRGTFITRTGQGIGFANLSLAGLAFTTTDATGAFAFNDVPLGTYRLTATDAVTGRSGFIQVPLAVVNEERVVQVMETALGEIVGAVLNGYGNGLVPGAEVTLIHSDPFVPSRTVTTGPDGRFRFPGTPAGLFRLDARDPISKFTGSGSATLPETASTFELNLQLQPLADLVVTVLKPDGVTPEPLATVEAFIGNPSNGVTLDTDAAGTARFAGLPLGTYGILARSREVGRTRQVQAGRVTLANTAGTEAVTLILRGTGTVQGRVLLAGGTIVVPGAQVELTIGNDSLAVSGGTMATPLAGQMRSAIAGSDGSFAFADVPLGGLRLTATNQALAASVNVAITIDGEALEQDLVLAASGTVTGRLIRTDGTVVPSIDVLLTFASTSALPGRINVRSGIDGRFSASLVPVGAFQLAADAPDIGGIIRTQGLVSANDQLVDLGDLVFDEDFPQIVSITPADTSDGVDIHTVIEMLVSEPLNPATVNATGVFVRPAAGGAALPATLELAAPPGETSLRLLRLTPLQPLESLTTYKVFIVSGDLVSATGGVTNRGPQDLVGRSWPAMFAASFTTRDQRPPELLSFTPEAGAVQVDPRSVIRLSFDEPIRATGLAVTLTGPGGSVPGVVAVGVNSLVMTFTANADLQPNALYTVSVDGVQDLAGNSLVGQPLVRSFATLDTLGPMITELRIKDGRSPVAGSTIMFQAVLAQVETGVRVRMTADLVAFGQSPAGVLELPYTVPAQGQIVIRAIATDAYGNDGPLAERTITVVPNAPPQIKFTRITPLMGAVPSGGAFAIAVSALDDGNVTELRAAVAGALVIPVMVTTGSAITFAGTIPANAVPGSKVKVVAVAGDDSGESTGEQALDILVSDATAPAVAITAPASNARLGFGEPLLLETTSSDNGGTHSLTTTVTGSGVNETRTMDVTAAANQNAVSSIAIPLTGAPVNGGLITATVRATDSIGLLSTLATRTFRLPDNVPPTISSFSPLNTSINRSVVEAVDVTFNEEIDTQTVAPASITVQTGGDVQAGTFSFHDGNRRVRWIPAAPLTLGATVSVTVGGGVLDTAGNATPGGTAQFSVTTFAIIQPVNASNVVEGQTITLQAGGSNGSGISQVSFTANGLSAGTGAASSYSVSYPVPTVAALGGAVLTIGAQAVTSIGAIPLAEVGLTVHGRGDDADGDTLLNGYELDYGLDPFLADAGQDKDSDGLTNLQEFQRGTKPNDSDTDDDLLLDGAEIIAGTDPLDPDTDNDGALDGVDSEPLVPGSTPRVDAVALVELVQNVPKNVSVTARDADGNLTSLGLLTGLKTEFFTHGGVSSLSQVSFDVTPAYTQTSVATISYTSEPFWPGGPTSNYAARIRGSIGIPTTGSYTFFTSSDDGSDLWIDGVRIVNNDGTHGTQEASGAVSLTAGLHFLEVRFFENGGGASLTASWQGPGIAKQLIQGGTSAVTATWVDGSAVLYPQVIGGFDASRGGELSLRDGLLTAAVRVDIATAFPSAVITATSTLTPEYLATVDVLAITSVKTPTSAITPLSAAEKAALRAYVEAGGAVFLTGDNDVFAGGASEAANQSLFDPFGVDITGTVNDTAAAVTVINPSGSPWTSGPYGILSSFTVIGPGWFESLGPDAQSVATTGPANKPALAMIPAGALTPQSGPVFLGSDAAMPSALMLNTVAMAGVVPRIYEFTAQAVLRNTLPGSSQVQVVAADRDGLQFTRIIEVVTLADLDGDGIPDRDDADIDGDGLTNAQELALGTSPTDSDSDDDNISDGADPRPLFANRLPVAHSIDSKLALQFDGTNDAVSVPDNASLDFGTGDFTVETWIMVPAGKLTSNSEYGVINKNSMFQGVAGWGMELSTYGSFPNYGANFYITNQTVWGNTNVSAGTLLPGTWYHLAATRSGTTTRFFLNGVQTSIAVNSGAAGNVDNALPVILGDHSWGPTFPGLIDEIRIWNIARTADQIRDSVNRRMTPPQSGLVALWRGDEGSGLSLVDQTSNANHGAPTGGLGTQMPGWTTSGAPIIGLTSSPSSSDLTITLTGTDADNDPLTSLITALPAHGRLYQTADGVTRGAQITSIPSAVTDPSMRVIHERSAGYNGLDQFLFRLNDGFFNSSAEGIVTLELVTSPTFDTDGDGLPDGYELANSLNPEVNDAAGDPDNDGLTNIAEHTRDTNPQDADSDGDLLKDGAEVALGTNPLNRDTDGDGLPDGSDPNPLAVDVGVTFVAETTVTMSEGESREIDLQVFCGSAPLMIFDYDPASTPTFASLGQLIITNTATTGGATAKLALNPLYDASGTYTIAIRAAARDGKSGVLSFTVTIADTPALTSTHWKDPANGNWNDATKWTNGVPTASTVAVIDAAGASSYTVTTNVAVVGAGLVVNDTHANLAITQSETFGFPVEVRRGVIAIDRNASYTLTLNRVFNNRGTVRLTSNYHTTTVSGSGRIENAGLLEVVQANGPSIGAEASIFVPINVLPGARLLLNTNQRLRLTSGSGLNLAGTLDIQSNSQVRVEASGAARDLTINGGTLMGPGPLLIEGSNRVVLNSDLDTSTHIALASSAAVSGTGRLTWHGSHVMSGMWQTRITFAGDAIIDMFTTTLAADCSIDAGALLAVNPANGTYTLTLNGIVTNGGTLRLASNYHTTNVNGSGRIDNAGILDVVQSIGGTNNAEASIYVPVHVLAGGRLLLNASQRLRLMSGSSLTVAGTVDLRSGSQINSENNGAARDFVFEVGSTLLGPGTIELNGSNQLVLDSAHETTARLELYGSSVATGAGAITLHGGQVLTGRYTIPVILAGDVTGSLIAPNFQNAVSIRSGAMLDAQGATFGGATLIESGASVSVNRNSSYNVTINGVLTNNGTLQITSSYHTTTINGSGRIDNGGVLEVVQAIGGTNMSEASIYVPINVLAGGQLLLNTSQRVRLMSGSSVTVAGTVDLRGGSQINSENSGAARDVTFEAGSVLLGPGTIELNGSNQLILQSAQETTAKIELYGSSLLSGAGAITLHGAQVLTGRYTVPVTLAGDATGSLIGADFQAALSILSGAIIEAQSVIFGGATFIEPGASVSVNRNNSHTLTINGVLTNYGTLQITSNWSTTTVNGSGRIDNAGLLEVVQAVGPSGGQEASIYVPINVLAGGQLLLNASQRVRLMSGSSVTVAGTVDLRGGSQINSSNNGAARDVTFEADSLLLGPGTLEFNGSNRLVVQTPQETGAKIELYDSSVMTGTGAITFHGAQVLSGRYTVPVTLAADTTGSFVGADFQAVLSVLSGATMDAQGATFGGATLIESGASVAVNRNNSYTLTVNSVLTNNGTLQITSNWNTTAVIGSGRIDNAGLLEVVQATGPSGGQEAAVYVPINISSTGRFLLNTSQRVVFLSGSSLTTEGIVDLRSGSQIRSANSGTARDITLLGGALTGVGTVSLQGSNRLVLAAAFDTAVHISITDSAIVAGTGRLTWHGSHVMNGSWLNPITFSNDAMIDMRSTTLGADCVIDAGALIAINPNGGYILTTNGVLTNNGTLRQVSRWQTSLINGSGRIENNGLIDTAVGVGGMQGVEATVRLPVNINTGGTFRMPTNGWVVFGSGSSLANSGTTEIGAGGRIRFETSAIPYMQTSSGRLVSQIASASSYGQMTGAGIHAFGGTLQLSLLGGYVPPANTVFTIANFNSRSGDFSGVVADPAVVGFNHNFTATTLQVTATALPGDAPELASTYDEWRSSVERTWGGNGGSAFGASSVDARAADSPDWDSDVMADPDRDGSVNLLEYAFQTNPLDARSLARMEVLPDSTSGRCIELRCRMRSGATDIVYVIETSADLKRWTPVDTNAPGVFRTVTEPVELGTHRFRLGIDVTRFGGSYWRVQVLSRTPTP